MDPIIDSVMCVPLALLDCKLIGLFLLLVSPEVAAAAPVTLTSFDGDSSTTVIDASPPTS
jgi:hypothetical protein